MQRLKAIYPEFADKVDFYAVNADPSDSFESVAEFGQRNGYPWPMAQPAEGMLKSFRITKHSTKVAFGADGVIVYRAGFSAGSANEWRELFRQLSAGGS